MNEGLMKELLLAIKSNEDRLWKVTSSVSVLTNEIKNLTAKISEDTIQQRKDIETLNRDINKTNEAINAQEKRITYLEYIGNNDKSLLKSAMSWLQWFVIAGIALIQLIKGL